MVIGLAICFSPVSEVKSNCRMPPSSHTNYKWKVRMSRRIISGDHPEQGMWMKYVDAQEPVAPQ
jgi:hypothetical protein